MRVGRLRRLLDQAVQDLLRPRNFLGARQVERQPQARLRVLLVRGEQPLEVVARRLVLSELLETSTLPEQRRGARRVELERLHEELGRAADRAVFLLVAAEAARRRAPRARGRRRCFARSA
jgi:hypothetical protein